ncbi:MAG TPA: cytochrome P450 [Stellaceae bacterium]|nr:cytochrome P450 [Stellaceae bacterium]
MAKRIPRLPGLPILGNLLEFKRDRLGTYLRAAREVGEVAELRIGPLRAVVLSAPEHMQTILVDHGYDFVKNIFYHYLRRALGLGLVTSEGQLHKRQRKLVAPLLQHRRIASYAETMVRFGELVQAQWREGEEIDAQHQMMRITLGIVGKTLFDAEVLDEADEIGPALAEVNRYTGTEIGRIVHLPMWWPTPRISRARRALRRLDQTIYRLIRERRASGQDAGDILSMLLMAQEENGEGMTDVQIRDEVMTIFAAGHETTAVALTWTSYLLCRHPGAYRRLQAECDAVLGGRAPTIEDLPQLPYALQVFKEAMRLYPPVYAVGRQPLADFQLGEYLLPRGGTLILNIYAIHRRPDLYPNPERFDPDRFEQGREKNLPRHAYLPFGAGPRVCIGNHFALMEGQLLLALLAQYVTFELTNPDAAPVPDPLITLRTRHGIRMRVHRRIPARDRIGSSMPEAAVRGGR